MHHHHLLLLLLITAILGTMIISCRKILLKRFSVGENMVFDLVFVTAVLLIISYFLVDKEQFLKKCYDGTFKKSLPIILVMTLLIGCSIVLGHTLLKNTDMSYFYSLRTGMRIILVTLVGYLFFSEAMTIQKIFGFIFILLGIFLIHYKNGK
jgi:multidrug transporter EmrE-like cation transporter